MALQPLGEKIIDILVNGAQQQSFTQQQLQADYDVAVSNSVSHTTDIQFLNSTGDTTFDITISPTYSNILNTVVVGMSHSPDNYYHQMVVNDGSGAELYSTNYYPDDIPRYVQNGTFTVDTVNINDQGGSDTVTDCGVFVAVTSYNDSISIDSVTQS